jgi:hypothetical protein
MMEREYYPILFNVLSVAPVVEVALIYVALDNIL